MSRFTVTTDSGNGPETADEPIEFPDTKAATDDAQIALAEMARDKLPNGKRADFVVKVEDETGDEIYRANLSFTAKDKDDLDRDDEASDAAAEDVANSLKYGPRE